MKKIISIQARLLLYENWNNTIIGVRGRVLGRKFYFEIPLPKSMDKLAVWVKSKKFLE